MRNDLIISTTDSLDGYQVEKYMGIISERTVVGAGFFSEFFAGLTDILGGRSGKFEARLAELYASVMEQLKKTAKLKGANAIIGVHLDVDEISGKNMQMFMITATGTAVLVKEIGEKLPKMEIEIESIISGIELKNRIIAEEFIERTNQPDANIESINEEINTLISEGIILPIKVLIKVMNNNQIYGLAAYDMGKPDIFEKTMFGEYLSQYSYEHISNEISRELLESDGYSKLLLEAYSRYALPDYETINKLIDVIPPYLWSVTVIPVLLKYKEEYSAGDIPPIRNLCSKLTNGDFDVTKKGKGLFNKDVWICVCGHKSSLSNNDCALCSRDKSGLTNYAKREISEVVNYLKKIEDILNKYVKETDI